MGLLQGGGHGGVLLVLVPLVVVVILILVAGRKDDDTEGTRTQARYVGAIAVVALFVALFAFFGTIHALTDLIVDKGTAHASAGGLPPGLKNILDQIPGAKNLLPKGVGGGGGGGGAASDDADWRRAAQTLLLGLAAAAVYVFHLRRARKLAPTDGFPQGGTGRVARAALYGACFIAAVVVILAATKGLYGVFKVVDPSTFGVGNDDTIRQRGISEIISFGFLGITSAFIFLRSWHWLPEHRD
jgi:hypothetical protein